jgi:hypothetical protein
MALITALGRPDARQPDDLARLRAYQDALEAVEQPWTVSGVLGGLGLLWGEAGVGKSFVACSIAASVATGRPWLGHKVSEGAVVYIAGEGGERSVAKRLDAAVTALRCCDADEGPIPLYVVTPGIDFVAGPAELMGLMGNVRPELIVVDTLARCFGGDENSTEDMSKFVHALDVIRDTEGCSVLVVHHANKTDKTGSGKVRGSSVLYGAVDVSLQLVKDSRDEVSIKADKLRDRDTSGDLASIRFESVPIYGELDELGDEMTTRVVRPTAKFTALVTIAALAVIGKGVLTYREWRDALGLEKGEFDRLVVEVVGDPVTWGVEEIATGVYGTRPSGKGGRA